MSGGGGGGDFRPVINVPKTKTGGGGGGGSNTPEICNIDEVATLNSPNRNVIASLGTGDKLTVVFESGPPQRLVAKNNAGETAGSITSQSMAQIIQCIQEDVKYVAEVISIHGGQCRIRIKVK